MEKHTVIYNPHAASGYWVRLEKDIAKIYCPWGVSFELQALQIPGWGSGA